MAMSKAILSTPTLLSNITVIVAYSNGPTAQSCAYLSEESEESEEFSTPRLWYHLSEDT